MPSLVLCGISKQFCAADGRCITALDRVSFTLNDRELLVVLGPAGSGKTTLLRLIAGLDSPAADGQISLDAVDLRKIPPAQRDVALVFQNHSLYPHLTVRDNLALALKLRGVPAPEVASRIGDVVEMLALADFLDRLPETLSGGEYQLVALGRALVRRPKLLLFDEPLSHLDTPRRLQLRELLRHAHAASGASTILVTHDQADALALGDRIAVLHAGAIRQIDPPEMIYYRPADRFVAEFVGAPAINSFFGHIVRSHGHCVFVWKPKGADAPIAWPLPDGLVPGNAERSDRACVLSVRPEDVVLSGAEPEGTCLAGEACLERLEFAAHERIAYLRLRNRIVAARIPAAAQVPCGETVPVRLRMNRVHLFDAGTGAALRTGDAAGARGR